MLYVDKDGWTKNSIITKKHKPAVEHSRLNIISAVVLHRTGTANANSVLNAWDTKKEGTHFLISESGEIYQTASLFKQCWHVGKIYSRCRLSGSCSEEDAQAIEDILHKRNTNWGKKFRFVTRHELKKTYPDRFPHNHDSIGIEIVGAISRKEEIYKIPNTLQLDSLFWLLDALFATYTFSLKDIYAHGQIAHKDKKKSEGASCLKAYSIHREKVIKSRAAKSGMSK